MNKKTDEHAKFKRDYEALLERFANPEPKAPAPLEYVIEECAELIQAIQHMRRAYRRDNTTYANYHELLADKSKSYNDVIKEMAHVYTLMDAARIYHDIEWYEIEFYQQKLIDRYLNQPNDGRHIPEDSGQPD